MAYEVLHKFTLRIGIEVLLWFFYEKLCRLVFHLLTDWSQLLFRDLMGTMYDFIAHIRIYDSMRRFIKSVILNLTTFLDTHNIICHHIDRHD